jgi:hypothetical protein
MGMHILLVGGGPDGLEHVETKAGGGLRGFPVCKIPKLLWVGLAMAIDCLKLRYRRIWSARMELPGFWS